MSLNIFGDLLSMKYGSYYPVYSKVSRQHADDTRHANYWQYELHFHMKAKAKNKKKKVASKSWKKKYLSLQVYLTIFIPP